MIPGVNKSRFTKNDGLTFNRFVSDAFILTEYLDDESNLLTLINIFQQGLTLFN